MNSWWTQKIVKSGAWTMVVSVALLCGILFLLVIQ